MYLRSRDSFHLSYAMKAKSQWLWLFLACCVALQVSKGRPMLALKFPRQLQASGGGSARLVIHTAMHGGASVMIQL